MSGRHAGRPTTVRRRFPVLLAVATALGIWLGVDAPNISPVAPPVAAAAPAAPGATAAAAAPAPAGPAATTATVPTQPDPVTVAPQAGAHARNRGGNR